jgi:hypothetical protein
MVVSNTMVFYSVAITYSTGKLEHGRNPSFDVISYVWTLRMTPSPHDVLPRRNLGLLRYRSLCVSTTGEYLRTQQALTIGWK